MLHHDPKTECMTFLKRLFDIVPDFPVDSSYDSRFKSIARICKLCETQKSRFSKVMLNTPCLVTILSGTKRVAFDSEAVEAKEGDFLLLPSGVKMDMFNSPDPREGIYRSVVMEFEPRTLRKFATTYPEAVGQLVPWAAVDSPQIFASPPDIYEAEAFIHLSRALARGDNTGPTVELRVFELIFALLKARKGRLLFTLCGADIGENVRRLFALHPARPWTADAMATQLGVSVSTLSRRLRQEGTNFRNLLRDTRMTHAMEMLRNKQHTVTEVAEACGYSSLPKFKTRFKENHGVHPTQITN